MVGSSDFADRCAKAGRLICGRSWRIPWTAHEVRPIDGVWLWVDGNAPGFRTQRRRWSGEDPDDSTHPGTRFRHVGEVEFSLLSALRFCPWLRRLLVITGFGERPRLADRYPDRIRVVDHREFIPGDHLPLFNSQALECWLDRIPGLSERFLYFNDDTFVGRPLSPLDWYDPRRDKILLREDRGRGFAPKVGEEGSDANLHLRAIANTEELLDRHFGTRRRFHVHHQVRLVSRGGMAAGRRIAGRRWETTARSRFRSEGDIGPLHLAFHCDHQRGRGTIRNDLLAIFAYLDDPEFPEHLARVERLRPPLFCLNDGEHPVPEHRHMMAGMLRRYYLDNASPVG